MLSTVYLQQNYVLADEGRRIHACLGLLVQDQQETPQRNQGGGAMDGQRAFRWLYTTVGAWILAELISSILSPLTERPLDAVRSRVRKLALFLHLANPEEETIWVYENA